VACRAVINKYRQLGQDVGSNRLNDQGLEGSRPNCSFRINSNTKADSKTSALKSKPVYQARGSTNSTPKLKGKSASINQVPIRKILRLQSMNVAKIYAAKSNRNFALKFTPSNDPLIQQNTLSHSVRGFSSITACTKPGECFQQTKTNQDAYLINTEFDGDPNKVIFGVFDGHGTYGDKVSQYLKDNFASKNYFRLKLQRICWPMSKLV
jgi:hypothetical protein